MAEPENVPNWQKISQQKQAHRDSLIPPAWKLKTSDFPRGNNVLDVPLTCGILTEEEIDITSNYDAVDLVKLMKDGKHSVEAVTLAFCKRAAIALQLTNCLTEIMFDMALERARYLDVLRQNNPTALGPLFGLPISLKDAFEIPGFDATIGYVAFANKPAKSPSALVTLLSGLGAVFYCKTNLPQTMMTADSDNNVWGRTLNPHNTSLTAGRSSGGEAALMALRGSIIGIGSDIAGSVRIPSAACGIYGIRPSAGVVPFGGQKMPSAPGLPYITPVVGPMATSARACRYLLECIVKAHPVRYDSQCVNLSWPEGACRRMMDTGRIRISVAQDDGHLTVAPPQRRALQQAVSALQDSGITVIPIQLPEFFLDTTVRAGDPLVPSVVALNLVKESPTATLDDIARFNAIRNEHKEQYLKIWNDLELDAIIMPSAPHTAVPHDKWTSLNYTAIWNYLDNPAAVIPIDTVKPGDIPDTAHKYGADDAAYSALYTGPEAYKDAPTSIQVVGRRQEDVQLSLIVEYFSDIIHAHLNLEQL
ncbi:hypothetical protein MW887_000557 [Aspergillus wentii]|nr:hypothetical protein MW887_000557 [Aspergillus wentii]